MGKSCVANWQFSSFPAGGQNTTTKSHLACDWPTAPLVVVAVAVSGGLARVQESRRSGWVLRERPFKSPLKSRVFLFSASTATTPL
jgi:hypothetical protein